MGARSSADWAVVASPACAATRRRLTPSSTRCKEKDPELRKRRLSILDATPRCQPWAITACMRPWVVDVAHLCSTWQGHLKSVVDPVETRQVVHCLCIDLAMCKCTAPSWSLCDLW